MPATDYEAIHTAIKEKLVTHGFRYSPAHKWVEQEAGIFPESVKNNSFTIRMVEQGPSDKGTTVWSTLDVDVEFVLEAMNDKYLDKLGDSQVAVVDIKSITSDDLILVNPNGLEEWTAEYLGDRVMVTYSNVNFEIRSR